MFKIRVNSLPEAGLKIEQEFSSDSLNQRLAEPAKAAESPIVFTSDIKASLLCEKAPHGMSLNGTLKATCRQQCGLCAIDPEREIQINISHIFKFHSDAASLPEDDVGVTYYSGEHIDLGACIEDLIILQLSPFWHPEIDSSGSCTLCNKNPRTGFKPVQRGTNQFAELLTKAGIHNKKI